MGNGWEIGEFLGKILGVLVIFRKILGNFAFSKNFGIFQRFPENFWDFWNVFFIFFKKFAQFWKKN